MTQPGGLPQPQPADAAMALIVPVRVHPLALAAGYLGLFSLLFFGGPGCFVAGAFFAAPKATIAVRLAALTGALILGPLPPLLFGILGHRALARDPSARGIGRVITAYVAAALMLVAFAGGAALALTRA